MSVIELLTHRHHDITDRAWALIENLLPGRPGQTGDTARNHREFISAVFRELRTGSPWRDLTLDFDCWKHVHRRFTRCRGVATRYARRTSSFLASVHARLINMWLKVFVTQTNRGFAY